MHLKIASARPTGLLFAMFSLVLILLLFSFSTLHVPSMTRGTTVHTPIICHLIFDKYGVLDSDLETKLKLAAAEILLQARPLPQLTYVKIRYNLTVMDDGPAEGLTVLCDALAEIREAAKIESYEIVFSFDTAVDVYSIESWVHSNKYVPPEVEKKSIELALRNSVAMKFMESYPDATAKVTYLDPVEVALRRKKDAELWASIPQTTVLLAIIEAWERGIEEVPTVIVVVNPEDYEILAVWTLWWNPS